jgi:hypothetical protein
MPGYLVGVEVHPDTPPLGLAPIEDCPYPKAVSVLKADGKLLLKTAHLEAVPMFDVHSVGEGYCFQQVHEPFPVWLFG